MVLEALFTLGFVRLGLWLLPFGLLLRLVRRPPGKTSEVEVSRLTKTLSAVSRYAPRATCLAQALAGQRLLAAHGYAAQLRLGVQKNGGCLKAHAWLEHDGVVVVGRVSNLADYRPLPSEGERP